MSPGTQVSAVALAPDGRTVAATTADGHLRFADLQRTARAAPAGLRNPPGRADAGTAWSLAFSGDGRWLATAGTSARGRPLLLWDVRRQAIVSTALLSPPEPIATDVALQPRWHQAATLVSRTTPTADAAIEILSVPQLAQLKTVRVPAGKSMRFSRDGRLLVFGDSQGRVWLYDTRTWRPRGRPLACSHRAVDTVNFSPDGRTLATTSDDGTTRLWDVASGRPIGAALPGLAQHDIGGGVRRRWHTPRHAE